MGGSRLVYSTDGGGTEYCSTCDRPKNECRCGRRAGSSKSASPSSRRLPDDGVVRIFRDRSGRHGKTVTVVAGLRGDSATLEELGKSLKRLCGSGGALKDGAIEIQGDHREKVAARLSELGYRVKLAGG
jgi:translation initiation factor 1